MGLSGILFENQARSNFKRIYTTEEHGVPFVSSRDMFFFPLQLGDFYLGEWPSYLISWFLKAGCSSVAQAQSVTCCTSAGHCQSALFPITQSASSLLARQQVTSMLSYRRFTANH